MPGSVIITDSQGNTATVTIPVTLNQTAWGSTPNGTTGSNATTCLAKWPGSKNMRQFTSNGSGPPALSNIPVVSWSNKPPLPGTSYVNPTIAVPSSTTDFIWTPWHEVDGKVAQGQITLADWKNLLTRIAAQSRPAKVKLGVIVTAWGIVPSQFGGGGRDWHQYIHPAITEYGADFDGMAPSATSYPNDVFLRTLDVLGEIKAAGYRVSVPEFGSPLATWDPTGTARAEWMTQWADRFRQFGMHYVSLFDHTNIEPKTGTPYSVNDTPGINAWRAVIAS